MAANFKIGAQVTLNVVPPQGEVKQLTVDKDGNIQYLVEWFQNDVVHQRWFQENELTGV
jgi:hypothetical protein